MIHCVSISPVLRLEALVNTPHYFKIEKGRPSNSVTSIHYCSHIKAGTGCRQRGQLQAEGAADKVALKWPDACQRSKRPMQGGNNS